MFKILNIEHEFKRDAVTTFSSFLQYLAATILVGSRCFVKSIPLHFLKGEQSSSQLT